MNGKQYILKAEATRVVQKNDRGIVTYRKRYKRGDVVDVSYIEDAQVQRLLEAGHLALDTGEATENEDDGTAAAAATTAATSSTGTVADLGSTATQSDQDKDAEGDRYDSMSYSDLQAEAKQRTGNGGGSAEDLRDRLREADAEDENE
jgi:hypothetical protein